MKFEVGIMKFYFIYMLIKKKAGPYPACTASKRASDSWRRAFAGSCAAGTAEEEEEPEEPEEPPPPPPMLKLNES
jgi:hypothetical protein